MARDAKPVNTSGLWLSSLLLVHKSSNSRAMENKHLQLQLLEFNESYDSVSSAQVRKEMDELFDQEIWMSCLIQTSVNKGIQGWPVVRRQEYKFLHDKASQ